jgi:hypothetical protein
MDRRRSHRQLLAFAAALIVAAAPSLAAQRQAAVAPALVNAATRLAMLGERMAKLHAQLGREILVTRSRRALGEAANEFDRGLREVAGAAPNAEIRENYLLLRRLWEEYRPAATHAPSAENARRLAERNEEVVWIASKGARLLHEQGRSRAGELVLAAGVVRSAAQRLAKLHFQRGWALPLSARGAEVKAAELELQRGLAELKAAPETGEELALELQGVENQFVFLKQAVERLDSGKDRPRQLEHVAKTADNIAEAMDRAARVYETVTAPVD